MDGPTNSSGEPLSPVSIITGGVAATIALAVSFGLDLTSTQTGAITAFVAFFAPVVVWLIGRRKVTPSKNVAAVVNTDGIVVAGEAASQANGTAVSVVS